MSERITRILDAHGRPPEAITINASHVETRPLDPVWDGVLWASKPTLLAGDPGLGKSMLTCDIAARVTTGAPWPCSDERREPANVVMLSAEDDPEDTVVPRLIAAGADLERVTFIRGVTEFTDKGERERWFSFDAHLDQLGQVLRRVTPRLVIVDPLSAYIGQDTDSHNEASVRIVLSGLASVVSAHRCSVLCVRHLRKAEGANAQHKIIGSVAFAAAARAVFIVTRDPEAEERRLMLCAKNNLAPDTAGFSYCVETNDEGIPRIAWGDERETRTADEVLGSSADKKHVIDGVEDWLRETLAGGPVASRDLRRLADEAGHSWRTVERARGRMGGIKIERDVIAGQGSVGPWQWRLVTPPASTPPNPHLNGGGLVGGYEPRADTGFRNGFEGQSASSPSVGGGGGVVCPDCNGRGCDLCGDWKAPDGRAL